FFFVGAIDDFKWDGDGLWGWFYNDFVHCGLILWLLGFILFFFCFIIIKRVFKELFLLKVFLSLGVVVGGGEALSPQRRLAAKMLPDGTFPRSRHHHLPVP
ncbi:hypothetical protein, partial [Enterobacter hormaechei]